MKPILINNLDFAKKQSKISHEINVDTCQRLLDFVKDDVHFKKNIHYTLAGSVSKFHLPSLSINIEASLPVLCQRCLQNMQLDLSLFYEYVIAESEPAEFENNEEIDWIASSREMNINELVEDELLIAMPLGPMHSHACKPILEEGVEKPNPFAVLQKLIKS
jgi:uncharacterized protein